MPREREIVHVPNFWTQNAESVSKFSADSKFKYISKLRNLLYRLLKSANLRYFSSRPNLWTGKLVHPFLIFCFLHSRITWIYQVSKNKRRREREELRCVWDFSVSGSHTCLFNLLSRLFSGMLHKTPSKSSLEGSIAWHKIKRTSEVKLHKPFQHCKILLTLLLINMLGLVKKLKENYGENIATYLNPLTPRSDQHGTSPYNILTLSSKQVMRIFRLIK